MTNQQKALWALLLAAFLGGSTGVFVKVGVLVIPPLTFTFLRFLLSTICLLPFISLKKIDKAHLKQLILLSFLPVTNVVLFAFGVKETTAIMGGFLYAFTPILVALFGYLIYKQKLSTRKSWGLLLGMIGAIFLVGLPALEQATQYSGTLWGNFLVFSAVVTFALYSLFIKKHQEHHSVQFITFVFVALTTLVLSPIALTDLLSNPDWFAGMNMMTWISLLFVGIGGGMGVYLVYQYALKFGGPLPASMMTFLQPIAGSLMAFLLLGEKLTINILLGSLPIFVGAWLVTVNKKEVKGARAS